MTHLRLKERSENRLALLLSQKPHGSFYTGMYSLLTLKILKK